MTTTAQPTTLPQDLTAALKDAGVSRYRTQRIVALLPDRGRYELLAVLNDRDLDNFLTRWIGDLAETLRTPVADAAHIRSLLTAVTR